MKESFPVQNRESVREETPQVDHEKRLSLDEIEAGLKYADDTGRLLEKAYWEDAREQYFKTPKEEPKNTEDEESNVDIVIPNPQEVTEIESEPKTQKPPPIANGSIFNPEDELIQIKSSSPKERRKKLIEYKEKLAYQQEGLAKIQEQIIEEIRNNPDILFDELYSKVIMEGALNYGLITNQVDIIIDTFSDYKSKHEAVRSSRQLYPSNQDLYKAVFGVEPKGGVDIIEGPMTLYFKCFDVEDYARIHSQSFLQNKDLTEEDVTVAKRSGGVSINTSLIPELTGTLIAENSSVTSPEGSSKILVHEEQHAIKRLFWDERNRRVQDWYSIAEAKTANEFENLLTISNRFERETTAENRAKDEILAYFKDNTRNQIQIYSLLTLPEEQGGLYDYLKHLKSSHGTEEIEWLNKNIRDESERQLRSNLFWKNNKMVFVDEYNKMLKDGINTAFNLRFKGSYTTEEVIAILIKEPLSKWPKVSKRLLQVKKSKQFKQ